MTADILSQSIFKLSQSIEELQAKYASNPANAPDILSDALKSLQTSIEDLQVAKKALEQQNDDITDRKQKEETILRAKEDLERTFDSVPDLIAIIDKEYRIVRANKAMATRLGVSPEECAGLTCYHAVHGMTAPPSFCPHRRLIEDGLDHGAEVHEDRLGGDFIVSVSPLTDPEGKLAGSIHVARDITERKRAENALRESEERYRMLFEHSIDAIILRNPKDGAKILSANPAACQMLGWTEEELIGKGHEPMLDPEDPVLIALLDERARSGSAKAQLTYRRKDGTTFPGEVSNSVFTNSKGEPRTITIIRDITERKRGEEALRQSEEHYYRLFEDDLTGDFIASPEGRILVCNPAYIKIFGFSSREEAVGSNLSELYLHPVEYAIFIKQLCEQKVLERYECNYRRLDGATIHTAETIVGTFDERGNLVQFKGYVFDDTERKRAEEALREARDNLEIRVKERTEELEQANARLQIEMAERAEAEELARAKHQQIEDVMETLPSYVILMTPDHRVTFSNRAFREKFGGPKDRRCFEILARRAEPCEICEMQRVLKTNEPYHYEWLSPDGLIIDFFDFPFTDSDGSPLIGKMGIDITERKKTEEALRTAWTYNRSLIEASLDPLVTIGPDGKITDVNVATEIATGCRSEELLGTDFSDYFTDPKKARAGYEKAFKEGYIRDYPLEVQAHDGRKTPVLYNASVYKNDIGQVVGVFAAARDITDLKKAEAELEKYRSHLEDLVIKRTSELKDANAQLQAEIIERRRYEEALQEKDRLLGESQSMAKVGSWEMDLSTGNIVFSDEMLSILEFPPGQHSYEEFKSRIHPEDREGRDAEIKNAIDENKPYFFEYRIVLPDGNIHHIHGTGKTIVDSLGVPVKFVATAQDITERKRAEETLLESEAKYRRLFENSLVGIISIDLHGNVLEANDALLKVMGSSSAEATKQINMLEYPPLIDSGISGSFRQCIESGKSVFCEHPYVTKWGKKVHLRLHLNPILDPEGQVIGAQATVEDMSENKRAEEALRESEKKYRDLVENANSIIIRWDIQGKLTFFNEFAEKLFGYSKEEVLGRNVVGTIVPLSESTGRDLGALIEEIKRDPVRYQLSVNENVCKNGDRVWIAWTNKVIYDDQGNLVEILSVGNDITERKKAEEALQISEERLRRASRAGRIGLFEWNIDRDLAYFSPEALELSGYEPDTPVTFETWLERVHPEDREMMERQLVEVHKKARNLPAFSTQAEFRVMHADGKTLWIEAISTYDLEGTDLIARGSLRDITSRKLTEEMLRESELNARTSAAKLKTIIDSVDYGISILDTTGKIVMLNDVASKYSQRIRGDDVDLAWDQANHYPFFFANGTPLTPEKGLVFPALAGNVIRNRDIVYGEGTPDEFWLSASAAPLRYDTGEILGAVFSFKDITERKRMGETLEKERNTLQAIMESTHANIAQFDPKFNFLRVNPAFVRGSGHNAEELIGRNFFDFFPIVEIEAVFKRVVETGEAVSYPAWPFEFPDQPERGVTYLDSTLAPIKDSSGQVLSLVLSLTDVTHLMRMEEALRAAKNDLEQKVLERTEDLSKANEKLQVEIADHQKAREAAEAAAEAKAAFLANMSHELRTPMNYILGVANLLLDEPLPPVQKEYVEIIKEGGDRMMALVTDILEISKLGKKKVALESDPLNIMALIEESLNMVLSQAEKKGLELTTMSSFGTPKSILGDYGKLRQVLVNLLSNAIKFTEEGGISVSVSSKASEARGMHKITFAVKDTGIGISPENLDKLFQPFSQVDMSFSRGHEGAGLGLAICKDLVELMGGRIWAESKPGEGSTFYFTIEAEALPDRQEKSIRADTKANAVFENLAEGFPLRILVAEDDTFNRRSIVDTLKKMGFRADAVVDGQEAIEALERRPYDLILMDVKMPRMDGLEATREIRKRWPDSGLKIVAITAYALEGDKEKCLEAGMDDYIAKPMQKDKLAKMLKRCALKTQ